MRNGVETTAFAFALEMTCVVLTRDGYVKWASSCSSYGRIRVSVSKLRDAQEFDRTRKSRCNGMAISIS